MLLRVVRPAVLIVLRQVVILYNGLFTFFFFFFACACLCERCNKSDYVLKLIIYHEQYIHCTFLIVKVTFLSYLSKYINNALISCIAVSFGAFSDCKAVIISFVAL